MNACLCLMPCTKICNPREETSQATRNGQSFTISQRRRRLSVWTRTTTANCLTDCNTMKHSLLPYLAIPAFVLTLVSCSKDSPDYGDEVIIEGDYRKPSSLADGEEDR